jgi:hypothetical protein
MDNQATWEDIEASLEQRMTQHITSTESKFEILQEALLSNMERLFSSISSVKETPQTPSRRNETPSRMRGQQQQDEPIYEHRNFRHNSNFARDLPKESYFNRRLSSQAIKSLPRRDSNIVRTIANIDPIKSGILLSQLDILHVHKWSQEMELLDKKHPHEDLSWQLFISKQVTFRINAYNEAKGIIPRKIISGSYLNLDNEELFSLLLDITLPTSVQEWEDDFKKLVQFRRLPKNQHEAPPDLTRFDFWYEGIIDFLYNANEANELLSAKEDNTFAPPLRTFNGKWGLMQILYESIPMGTGKTLHSQIDYSKVKACETLRDYTVLLQVENQKFQDASDVIKHNRAKFNMKDPTTSGTNIDAKSHTNTNAKSNMYNNSNRPTTPYRSPYNNRVNNLYEDIYNNNDVCNDDDYDEDYYYDYDETYGNRPDVIEGSNPGSNITSNLSMLNRENKDLPCYAELIGRCNSTPCRFSHDKKLLYKAWKDRMDELHLSKYKTPSGGITFQNPPQILKRDNTLRALSNVDERQVSTDTKQNPNINNNNDNRYETTPIANFGERNTAEPLVGNNRGQENL